MPRPLPSLPDDLLEEIFLRLPPDEPENLVRHSLASMLWFGRLSDPRFRGRYRDHHGAPPMLGFLHAWLESCGPEEKGPVPHFTPTTKFRACIPTEWGYSDYTAWDYRHGRVLLGDANHSSTALVVWDPMTACLRELPRPYMLRNSRAAVLCAVSGCEHRTCHAGPFQVVCVGLYRKGEYDDDCVAHACVSLPETGDWNMPCPPRFDFDVWGEPCLALYLPDDALIDPMPPVLVEEALHFMLEYDGDDSAQILKYDLRSNSLSLIGAPIVDSDIAGASILMAMEDGSLGFAHVDGLTLYIWSRQMDPNRVASWSRRTVIDLRNLLPIQNPDERLILVGPVEGSDTIFVTTDLRIYEINVKLQQWKKLWKREKFRALIPYMSFYDP